MDVLVISISISSYQVVNRVRKNVKIVVRVVVKIVVVYTSYKLSNKAKNKRNEYDAKKFYERKYDILDRFFSTFGYFNLVYSA